MPKRRVGVTLRKPSPAPEGAAAAVTTIDSGAEVSAPHVERSSDAAGELHDVVGTPLLASTAEAFVNGAAAALEKAASQIPTARLQTLIARGKEGYRELVLYLPEKLAEKLALYCTQHDIDMGRLVATAVEQHLEALEGNPRRRADDAPVLGPRSARRLMLGLAEWVRTLLASRGKWPGRAGEPTPT